MTESVEWVPDDYSEPTASAAADSDYPLSVVLGTGDVIHRARRVSRSHRIVNTRCGMRGIDTGRDGGIWCAECAAGTRAHDGRVGDGDHRLCAQVLKQRARQVGLDLHISTERPLVAGPYTTEPMVCPHGTPFWFEPTGEQIAYYVKNRIA